MNYGDPRLPVRFWSKVICAPSGCWEWTGFRNGKGYGMFRVDNKRVRHAHRVALVAALGYEKHEKETDHLCRNPACVKPLHLEFVSRRMNQERSPISMLNVESQKTHCRYGHPFDIANTGHRYDGKKARVCITCRRRRIREYCRRYDPTRPRRRKVNHG